MPSVLVTAFEPYGRWPENSSWLTLVHLTQSLPVGLSVTTRLYPVDFAIVRDRLAADLTANYDFALHLGQSPNSGRMHLESIAVNIGGAGDQLPDQFRPLVEDGPVGYRSRLPLADWAAKLRLAGIPAQVSHHAGTFLCNATMYLSHYIVEQAKLNTRITFIHLPLDPSQVLGDARDSASLSAATSAAAVRLILEELADSPNRESRE